jgi:uncharacterized protein YggE
MKRIWFLVIGLALVVTVALLSGCTTTSTPDLSGIFSTQQEGVWVSGTGEVTVVPDIATLRLGIQSQEVSVAAAQSNATEAMNRVMDALADNGVAKKDIQTQFFSIQRVTRWDDVKREEVVIGYRVSNIVTAKIRDIDKTGIVIDAVAAAGGDLTRIDSINFSVEDPSAYHEEAREKAMGDAEAKARQLTQLAGVTLGRPTFITESTPFAPPIYPRAVFEGAPVPAPAAPPPISPGETEISLTVQVVYSILK